MGRSRAMARVNWVSQGQCWGRCRVKRACRAGDPSHQSEDPPPEGFGGHGPFGQTDARCPAGEIVCHHLHRQPSAVGGEAAGRHVVKPDTVLEVSNGVLDLGVAAMVNLQFQGLPVPVGDEAVIAVGGEEGQMGTGRRLHPPDDEPYRRGIRLGYRLDEIPQAFVLADGDGEAD